MVINYELGTVVVNDNIFYAIECDNAKIGFVTKIEYDTFPKFYQRKCLDKWREADIILELKHMEKL